MSGTSTAQPGHERGDEVVTLNEADTGGRRTAIVFEAKHRKLGMRKIMDELDEALENREAAAAVAVFAEPAQSPTAVPFTYFANKAIVVFDPDAPAAQTLELVYMWARWEARRALALESTSHRRRPSRGTHQRRPARPGPGLDRPALSLHGEEADRARPPVRSMPSSTTSTPRFRPGPGVEVLSGIPAPGSWGAASDVVSSMVAAATSSCSSAEAPESGSGSGVVVDLHQKPSPGGSKPPAPNRG